MESDQALGMTVNGVDEVRRAVRTQVKGGVDWIKVSASGVAGSRFATAETEDLSADEIVAAVSEARKYGKPVHAHAHSREGVRACVEAGVLSLHSGEFVDEEILLLMREKGIIFSPTVAWLHARCLPGYVLAKDPAFVEEAWRAYAAAKISIVKARELGVKMAMGSDASHRFHHVPDGALELEYYQELGWPALEVIKAATKTAAEAINRGDSRGHACARQSCRHPGRRRACRRGRAGAPRQAQHQVDVPGGSRAGVGTRPRYFRRRIQGRRMAG